MPTVERPTVTLHYEDAGQGNPAIVFLHGWCDSSATWTSTIAEFSAKHRCLAPDMRGHGRSGRPTDHSYFIEALSNDVVAVCRAAGVERPVIVGHSFGAYLAARVALRYPGFAAGFVLEDQVLDFRAFHAQMATMEAVIRNPETHMAFREQMFQSLLGDRLAGAERDLVWRDMHNTPVDVALALWSGLFESTEEEIAEGSDQLMAALERQPAMTIEAAPNDAYHELLGRLAPSVRKGVIAAGHWIHLERPDAFRAALRAFLATL